MLRDYILASLATKLVVKDLATEFESGQIAACLQIAGFDRYGVSFKVRGHGNIEAQMSEAVIRIDSFNKKKVLKFKKMVDKLIYKYDVKFYIPALCGNEEIEA